jgi:DNA helicase-2/ATP-dependent DNA helicase PcrA
VGISELRICPQRKKILESACHLLVLGGPGSGKTTIALLKAATELSNGTLAAGQKILFLSFARATIARVALEAKLRIPKENRTQLEIGTYHGFAWSFIQTHGYLLTGHKRLRLLPPPEAAGRLAGVPRGERPNRLKQLLNDERLLGFDLFAGLAADLLEQSPRLCRMLSDSYPIIIVDEFQDTNLDEWRVITALAQQSRLIALADAEQRIYEFRGADPARLGEFIEKFKPTVFDFGKENNRSDGTDITEYGNDLLTGANIGKTYTHVSVEKYNYYADEPHSPLKHSVLAARQRLVKDQNPAWSLAILVSSKDMMLKVSGYLASSSRRLPEIVHDALIDPEGPALAAVLIGGLLEGASSVREMEKTLLADLVGHIRGCKGGEISQQNLGLVLALEKYRHAGGIRGAKRLQLIGDIRAIAAARERLALTGDPTADWLAVRGLLDRAAHESLKAVAEDARFIRLLNRGTQLQESLAEEWRARGGYAGARQIVSAALLQEHFSNSTRVWTGVNLMTIHKSKGKEFDEVIVFEGSRIGRLLRDNATTRGVEQARLALRVAVTRARRRTTVLTPSWASCPLVCHP